MPPGTEVDLRHRRKAGSRQDVDHHPGLHRVSGKERDGQKQLACCRDFPRERLRKARQLRIEDIEKRLCSELCDPPAVLFSIPDASIGRLDESDIRNLQQRAEEAVHEVRPELERVGVQVQDQIAPSDRERAPHRVALPERRAKAVDQLVFQVDLGAAGSRDGGGAVGGAGIDHDDLVDERRALVQ